MFLKARLKLTAWYLLIIIIVSFFFSFVIYHLLREEIERSLRIEKVRFYREQRIEIRPDRVSINLNLLQEEENRLKLILFFTNFGIFFISAGAGYFLAGKTLNPISKMLDEQSRFVTDASHELRTPLTILRSEIEVNLRDKNLTLENYKKILKSNLEEVINLENLSNNLLLLTQLEKTKTKKQNLERVDLKEIIDKSIFKILPLAKNKNIKIAKKISQYFILGNKENLFELFIILLDNAIKYSFSKSLIKVETFLINKKILINISDQGVGIEKKDLPFIFGRFYRSDLSRTKQKIIGYGLGLSIAKQIVNLHHGSINVKSEINKGSSFTVELPYKDL